MEKTVLIVDDEAPIRALLSRMLSRWGYQVLQAGDGNEGFSTLHQHPEIRLIISDLRMPRCNGLDFIRQATQQLKRDLEFIILTGDGQKADAVEAMRLGAREFLDKPIDQADLESAIDNASERLAQRDKERQQIRQLEIKSLQQTHSLDQSDKQLVDRLAVIAQYRDVETAEHCVRVGMNAAVLAKLAGLPEDIQYTVKLAGVLHDIGKIGIPDSILFKEGALTVEEFAVMKKHTDIGHAMLRNSGTELMETAASIALTHHERWDGSGYNQGLERDQTPIFGRLVTIADIYDALRSKRRYKPAFSHEKSVEIITQGDGRTDPGHFDPKLLALFREHHLMFADTYNTLPDQLI